MNDPWLFTLRTALIAFAIAWAWRGPKRNLKVKFNAHLWLSILAVGVVAIGGYSCWQWWRR